MDQLCLDYSSLIADDIFSLFSSRSAKGISDEDIDASYSLLEAIFIPEGNI